MRRLIGRTRDERRRMRAEWLWWTGWRKMLIPVRLRPGGVVHFRRHTDPYKTVCGRDATAGLRAKTFGLCLKCFSRRLGDELVALNGPGPNAKHLRSARESRTATDGT